MGNDEARLENSTPRPSRRRLSGAGSSVPACKVESTSRTLRASSVRAHSRAYLLKAGTRRETRRWKLDQRAATACPTLGGTAHRGQVTKISMHVWQTPDDLEPNPTTLAVPPFGSGAFQARGSKSKRGRCVASARWRRRWLSKLGPGSFPRGVSDRSEKGCVSDLQLGPYGTCK